MSSTLPLLHQAGMHRSRWAAAQLPGTTSQGMQCPGLTCGDSHHGLAHESPPDLVGLQGRVQRVPGQQHPPILGGCEGAGVGGPSTDGHRHGPCDLSLAFVELDGAVGGPVSCRQAVCVSSACAAYQLRVEASSSP